LERFQHGPALLPPLPLERAVGVVEGRQLQLPCLHIHDPKRIVLKSSRQGSCAGRPASKPPSSACWACLQLNQPRDRPLQFRTARGRRPNECEPRKSGCIGDPVSGES
jgi:hypothetical protein